MKALAHIFKTYISGKWKYILVYALSNLLQALFSLISLAMLIPFLNLLFGNEKLVYQKPSFHFSAKGLQDFFNYNLSQIIIKHDKMTAVLFIILVLMSAIVLKNLFLYISRYILNPLRNTITKQIREELYKKSLQLPIAFYSNERKGDLMSRMSSDVLEVEASIIAVMELLFGIPILVLFYLSIMLSLSVQLFLFLAVLLPLAGLLIGRISKRLKKQSAAQQSFFGKLITMLDESLTGLRIIKAYGAEEFRIKIFSNENSKLLKLQNAIATRRELASPLSEVLGVAVLCIILWFGCLLVFNGKIVEATFILFILIFTQLLDPLKKLSMYFYNVARGAASLERIDKIRNAENSIQDQENALSLLSFENSIEFKNVYFSYGDTEILKNINLKIEKGKTLAIVGESGSGKSTLVDLIPRFHDVQQGKIFIDGKEINSYIISDLRNLMGIVSQEPILFNDSIAQNVALGAEKVDDEKLKLSCQIANAEEFILQKEGTYQSNIGDRGSKLSGGEKQRLTIARAIYKNPPILILDEATSSLDTISEKMVQEAIDRLMKNRTSIVIAHRLSTIQNADEIILLEKGEIKERGTHQELIAQNGAYYKLVNMQYLIKNNA